MNEIVYKDYDLPDAPYPPPPIDGWRSLNMPK